MMHEAETFTFLVHLLGVPTVVQVRAFVVKGRVRAIRSAHFYAKPGGPENRIPTIDVGEADDETLDGLK